MYRARPIVDGKFVSNFSVEYFRSIMIKFPSLFQAVHAFDSCQRLYRRVYRFNESSDDSNVQHCHKNGIGMPEKNLLTGYYILKMHFIRFEEINVFL